MARTTTKAAADTQQQIAQPAPVDNLPAPRPRTAVAPIVPATWQEITAIAGAICRANMAPKSYCQTDNYGKLIYVNGKPVPEPEKVAIAIMHGLEVGLTPMASLQSLAVINGMPSLYGDGMLAVVRASGFLEDIVENMEWDNHGPVAATCKVKRRGEPTWGEMVCARDDAQKAGWWGKDGPWKLTPHRMMQMRARGWALRDKFADVLRGLHSAEEVEDMVDVTPQATATTGPTPAEPKREDYAAKAAETQPAGQAAKADNQALADASSGTSAGAAGQAGGTTAPAGGDKAKGSPAQPARKGRGKKEEPKVVTDVIDQNAPKERPPVEFEKYNRATDFIDFSEKFLLEQGRTVDEAKAWHEFYKDDLHNYSNHEFVRIQDAVADLLMIYGKIVGAAAEQPQ